MNTKAWLCDDHWDRCLRGDPCATCPSRPENKEAVEALASLQPEEHAHLQSAIMEKLSQIDEALINDHNQCKELAMKVQIIEERMKWQRSSTEIWLGRIGLLITGSIAAVALVVSMWDILTR